MVRRLAMLVLLTVSVMAVAGCGRDEAAGKDSEQAAGVAVIDFQKIIRGVGKQEEVEQQVEQVRRVYQERIDELQQQLVDLSAELEGQPAEGNEDKIRQYRQTEQELRAVATEGQQRINATRQQLYNEFGEQLEPIAGKIARARDMSVILSSAVTFYSTDAVDITEEVLDELLEMMKTGEYQPSVPDARTTTGD